MSGARTRWLAARCIFETLNKRQTLDRTFETVKGLDDLSDSDRGFVRALVQAAFRELGRIDTLLGTLVDRPFAELDPVVQALLRVGVVQSWRLGTPPHAAVAETVAAARTTPETGRASGLINAVLRRASELEAPLDELPPDAIWPKWLREGLAASLSEDDVRCLAVAQLDTPRLHLTAKDPTRSADMLDADLLENGSLALPMGPVSGLPGYEAGEWWVQDAAATLPVRVLAPQPGERILDLCAAPGGKTMQIAAAGADVIALDRSESRLKRVVENLKRTRLSENIECVVGDGRTYQPDALFDGILLDAPCSAMGTLARQPEGSWIKQPGDIDRFPKVQGELLAAAHDLLKPGGRVVYCVCTPLAREGRDVVERELKRQTWEPEPVRKDEAVGFEAALTAEGDLLTIPRLGDHHDAFFVSRLRKPTI